MDFPGHCECERAAPSFQLIIIFTPQNTADATRDKRFQPGDKTIGLFAKFRSGAGIPGYAQRISRSAAQFLKYYFEEVQWYTLEAMLLATQTQKYPG